MSRTIFGLHPRRSVIYSKLPRIRTCFQTLTLPFLSLRAGFPSSKELVISLLGKECLGSNHWLWNHLLHYDSPLLWWEVDPLLFSSFFSPFHYPLLPSTSWFISLQFWNIVPEKARQLSSNSYSSWLLKKSLVFFFSEMGCLTCSHQLWTLIKMVREWMAPNCISFCCLDTYQ